ncbi:hypothetical protein GUJ93_ZPchr0004g39071 [Zizania palustris]|uniref:Uncharacterized protein n=1 Tax=Zizania palustris TaxID=103762 RepID=A0A8J5S6B9_ZIZPA|nr:hypothetical protein GUJ93_ZPchr0004g39071 [Zizania palustris]
MWKVREQQSDPQTTVPSSGEIIGFGDCASKDELQKIEGKFDASMNAMQLSIQALAGNIATLMANVQRIAPEQQPPAPMHEVEADEEDIDYDSAHDASQDHRHPRVHEH